MTDTTWYGVSNYFLTNGDHSLITNWDYYTNYSDLVPYVTRQEMNHALAMLWLTILLLGLVVLGMALSKRTNHPKDSC